MNDKTFLFVWEKISFSQTWLIFARRFLIECTDIFMKKSKLNKKLSWFCFSCSTREASYNEEEGYVRMFLRGRPVVLHAPSDVAPGYDISKVATAPQQRLKLEWVYPFVLHIHCIIDYVIDQQARSLFINWHVAAFINSISFSYKGIKRRWKSQTS